MYFSKNRNQNLLLHLSINCVELYRLFTRATGYKCFHVGTKQSLHSFGQWLSLTQQRMDLLAILVTITSVYILVCIIFSLFIDGDLTTFMYTMICNGLSKNLSGKLSY